MEYSLEHRYHLIICGEIIFVKGSIPDTNRKVGCGGKSIVVNNAIDRILKSIIYERLCGRIQCIYAMKNMT